LDFGATHVVNADQTFMRFFPEAEQVAAPTGVKRVGSIVKTAPIDGCTLMVTAEFGTGKLLKPFLVMDGVTGATLDKKYATWATHTCEVTFQKKHWFDKHITIRWLEWLKKQFPDGSKVLLVWDHAPAHDDKTVDAWLALNIDWLRVMCIPGGLTSIMQVCDLTANAQLKAEFKVIYARWRAQAACANSRRSTTRSSRRRGTPAQLLALHHRSPP
jgi:hypothetical protein